MKRSTIYSLALLALATAFVITGCESPSDTDESAPPPSPASQQESEQPSPEPDDRGDRADERDEMVATQIEARGVEDERLLTAMREVPRHRYVPENFRQRAYVDSPLPIGHDQTISQPYIVALMSELLEVSPDDRVLEIGTGSGYQAAVLAALDAEVYSIEIICELAERAERDLEATGYGDVTVKCGDGYQGWPEHAPFDRVIVTAAPPEIPDALVEQLAVGGRMVVPVGEHRQELKVIEKTDDGEIDSRTEIPVQFVPMVPEEEL